MNIELVILKTFNGVFVTDYPGKGKKKNELVFCKLPDWDIPLESFKKLKRESRSGKPVNFPSVEGEEKLEEIKCN